MKNALFVLVYILTSFSQASADCSQNSYALTKESLVVAYDWVDGGFRKSTGHYIIGEFFFNRLMDPSCERIDVRTNGEVACVSENGQSTLMGLVQERQSRYEDLDVYSVHWNSNVDIKSKNTVHGCIYGLAVK